MPIFPSSFSCKTTAGQVFADLSLILLSFVPGIAGLILLFVAGSTRRPPLCRTIALILIVCAVIVFFVRMLILKGIEKKMEKDLLRCYEKDTWKFPAERFYDQLESSGIKEYAADSYTKKKIDLCVTAVLDQYKVPKQYHARYLGRAEQYIDEAKAAREAREQLRYVPCNGNPTETEKFVLSMNEALSACTGVAKRESHLKLWTKVANEESKSKRAFADHLVTVTHEKTSDPWLLGGAANAIGGVGAGIATAIQTEQRNAEIRQYNQQRDQMADMINTMTAGQREEARKIADAIFLEEMPLLREEQAQLKMTVIFEEQSDAAQVVAALSGITAEKTESGLVKVSVRVKNELMADAPENVRVVLDGILRGQVYSGDKPVGEILIPLPYEGIGTGGTVTCGGYCRMAIPKDGVEYEVRFDPDTSVFWQIEAPAKVRSIGQLKHTNKAFAKLCGTAK